MPERAPLISTAQELLDAFERWATAGPANFGHKRDLIVAELLRVRGDHPEAKAAFRTAVISAEQSGFTHDLALAHEPRPSSSTPRTIARELTNTRNVPPSITTHGRRGRRVRPSVSASELDADAGVSAVSENAALPYTNTDTGIAET